VLRGISLHASNVGSQFKDLNISILSSTSNPELGTRNLEPWNLEPGTRNPELGTRNLKLGTWNPELETWNPELGTKKAVPKGTA